MVQANPNAHIVIIIDDSIMDLRAMGTDTEMMPYFFNRRHLIPHGTISFMIATQKYVVCHPNIRSVITCFLVFPCNNNDWEKISKEAIFLDVKKPVLNALVASHWRAKRHNFIFIDWEKSHTWLNFHTRLSYV